MMSGHWIWANYLDAVVVGGRGHVVLKDASEDHNQQRGLHGVELDLT